MFVIMVIINGFLNFIFFGAFILKCAIVSILQIKILSYNYTCENLCI